jgi:hypothetical protein
MVFSFTNVIVVHGYGLQGQVPKCSAEWSAPCVHHAKCIDEAFGYAWARARQTVEFSPFGSSATRAAIDFLAADTDCGIIGGHDPERDGDVAPELGAVGRTPLTVLREQHFHFFLMTSDRMPPNT